MKSLEIVNNILNILDGNIEEISKEELKTIKQDLEVLEILGKKFEFEPIDSDTNIISEDEMDKVKQWLEGNE